jgi:hypothetical protein
MIEVIWERFPRVLEVLGGWAGIGDFSPLKSNFKINKAPCGIER